MPEALALTRRQMLGYSAAAGSLVVMAPFFRPARAHGAEVSNELLQAIIHINPDNSILIEHPAPEMGQGTGTAEPMLIAEELDADWDRVSVKTMDLMLKTDKDGNMAWKFFPQGAGGSTSISRGFDPLRKAGASARELLLRAAANRWSVETSTLRTEKSYVIGADNKRLSYGDLARDAAAITLPEDFEPVLKDRKDWKIVGQPKAHKSAHDIVTGQPLYSIDATYPGVRIACMARCPWLDGEVISVDDSETLKVPGVIKVVHLPRPDLDKYYTYLAAGVAVIAETFWAAKKGRDLLKIEWDKGPYANESTDSLDQHCSDLLDTTGQIVRHDGNFPEALTKADKVIRKRYRLPYVSHAQLEPQSAIAHVQADKCTLIGPFQFPSSASRIANGLTGIDRMNIEVKVPRLGGGFGRRLTADHGAEAVAISKAAGLPVKVMWTREDDLSHDFYRPGGHHEMIAAFDKDGKLTAWAHRLASPSKYYRRPVPEDEWWESDLYVDDFPAGLVDNLQVEFHSAKSGMPRGSWRAPAHTANAFVINSFMDELAEELGEDPLDLHLRLLGPAKELPYGQHGGPVFDTGRLTTVLKTVADKAGWGRKMPQGRALGLAGHFTFGGYVAEVADVELLAEGEFRVHKVWAAVDIGTVVNPNGVIAQTEGAINDGLNMVRRQEIKVAGGQVMTDNFDSYQMMRLADSVPDIDVTIIDSDRAPSGMGEMALPPLSPAVGNAIRRAGGPRLRHHPFIGST
ncbi:xanthine dehydrogenase family protein molybdopterin-binding subunit [Emcibacter sp.]|uniref:xanthine dehydrogenase family protein molybdopterin-binding subunit n=1 Tax=Emcibacter sp. TaxID=1979954 RepID=UPI002AA7DFCB|nr:molybdopterin cofactor-binding domain-containing protein [Emcibacter sp.]